jgi:hypothetical protein
LYRYVTALEPAISLAAFTSGDWGGGCTSSSSS